MEKHYSELSFGVDLIIDVYKITNPIIIAEILNEEFGLNYTIHQIADYLNIAHEDLEHENRKQYYKYFNY